ncbi:MAG: tripartite tricarboxylate transporter substrate binding protein, partial [Alphaproteobacteria bacterium]
MAATEPLRCIIPFGADGESSTAARLQRPVLRDLTGQDMVVDYRPGGGGGVVWSALNRLPADGRTIVGVNLPHIFLQPAAGAKYRTDDFAVVHIFHYTPHAIAVRANAPFDTLQDLVQAAKGAPGSIVFTGSGSATASQLAQRRFDRLAGTRTGYLPYEGTTAAIAALLGGEARAAWTYPTVGIQYDRSIRLLAIATPQRHPRFPSVPTFQEFGYPLVDGTWRGIAVPKATPEPARQALSDLFMTIANR